MGIMKSYVVYTAIALAFLAFIHSGAALQCWDCSSDQNGNCRDHFNVSQISRGGGGGYNPAGNFPSGNFPSGNSPRVITCENPSPSSGFSNLNYGYQRYACIKRVETDRRSGRTHYFRGCQILTGDERVGTCTNRNGYGEVTVDFCEYCDQHECNGAKGLQNGAFWIGLIPISLALALRK